MHVLKDSKTWNNHHQGRRNRNQSAGQTSTEQSALDEVTVTQAVSSSVVVASSSDELDEVTKIVPTSL